MIYFTKVISKYKILNIIEKVFKSSDEIIFISKRLIKLKKKKQQVNK